MYAKFAVKLSHSLAHPSESDADASVPNLGKSFPRHAFALILDFNADVFPFARNVDSGNLAS
jgi:hypothetical protein